MNKLHLRIIRKKEVLALTGFSKSTLYNRIHQGLWPQQISLGIRAVGFIETECNAVLTAMIEGQTSNQIKALVVNLIEQRKQLKDGLYE